MLWGQEGEAASPWDTPAPHFAPPGIPTAPVQGPGWDESLSPAHWALEGSWLTPALLAGAVWQPGATATVPREGLVWWDAPANPTPLGIIFLYFFKEAKIFQLQHGDAV